MPSKVTAFSWRVVRNRLPTLDNLVSRGVLQGNTNSLCSGCHLAMETVSHLFFECKLYSDMWIQLLHWVGVQAAMHNVCSQHLSQFLGLCSFSKEKVAAWQCLWFAGLYGIWLSRNNLIFNHKEVRTTEIVKQVKIKAWTWIRGKVAGFSYSPTDWMLNPLACLGMVVQ